MNEKLKVYDTKMQKTMDSLDSEMGTIRAGRANPNVLEQNYGRLLWNTNTNPTGSERICSGTENDSDPAMGEEHAQSYRESNHGF